MSLFLKSPVKEVLKELGLQARNGHSARSKLSKTAQEAFDWLKTQDAFSQNKKAIATWANVTGPTIDAWLKKAPFKGNIETQFIGTSTMFKVK